MLKEIIKAERRGLLDNKIGNIFQLSDDPNIVVDGDVKYIGYEDIGEYYSGLSKILTKHELEVGSYLAKYIGNGILLDLACGDGIYTVPIAKYQTKIVAGDISNKMLNILEYRAKINSITLETVELCRINALDLPFKDDSFDYVIGNSFLHLISIPEIAIREIHRVLKTGGKFLCFEDAPAKKEEVVNINEDELVKNKEYEKILYEFDSRYWYYINNEYKINQSRYSWKFNRDEACLKIFKERQDKFIECDSYKTISDLWEGYLYRLSGKGFSAQSMIPDEIHKFVFKQVMDEFTVKYGEKFYMNYKYTYVINGTELMIEYIK